MARSPTAAGVHRRAADQETRPPSIPPEVWAHLQTEAGEWKAQNFQSREQVLAWLQARGYEDGEMMLQRLRAGGEISLWLTPFL